VTYLPRIFLFLATAALLFALPWWLLVYTTADGPPLWIGTAIFALCAVTLPAAMLLGHGGHQSDAAAVTGDTLLGVGWVLFTWSVLGAAVRAGLIVAGVHDPWRSRSVAIGVAAVTVVLTAWAVVEARRVPRVRTVPVTIPRLGPGLDGLRLVVLTDTHYGPLNRTRWSERVVGVANTLQADIVCHAGDLADGPLSRRRRQVDPLAKVQAGEGRFYITGNHEYFGDAAGWIEHMASLGWQPLINQHEVISRGGDRLIVAGIDDPTGATLAGHGPDLNAALAGADPDIPVVLVAHQPKQIPAAVQAGVALQISGHTHGGQIWPFHYLVRLDQPVVAGLSHHGPHTQLYTSRGTGFWGPPLRLFAPSEITLLVLHSPAH
jgi:predicted MPP superfamily phosphohydrolase